MKHKQIVAGLFLALSAQCAVAKDITSDTPYNWRGFFVGVQAGDLWSQTKVTDTGTSTTTNEATNGWVGGIEYGYNFQNGEWVFGSESDFGLSGAHGIGAAVGSANQYDINWDSHSRVRVGFAPNEGPLLLYVAGGLAIAHFTFTDGESSTQTSATYFGGSAGVGVEYGFSPNLSGQLEFVYDDYAMGIGTGAIDTPDYVSHLQNASTIRAAINFHF